jgi:hypothetical protein
MFNLKATPAFEMGLICPKKLNELKRNIGPKESKNIEPTNDNPTE